MSNKIIGRALKYGDNINTDIISPPAYMELSVKDAAKYAMSAIDPDFSTTCKQGDIFVAGDNLGSGSSRETSPLTLYELGIRTIVAKSYARIFYRNCINVGILTIECPDTERISMFDQLEIDYVNGHIFNKTKDESYVCDKIPSHIMQLVNDGGLVKQLEKKLLA